MLVKYGNTMTMIDATYNTTLYDVPLFLYLYAPMLGILLQLAKLFSQKLVKT